jgi:hypothetical protein
MITKVVRTQQLPDGPGPFTLTLPIGAKFGAVADGGVTVYADESADCITRQFVLVEEGGAVEDTISNNGLVPYGRVIVPSGVGLHLFEVL